MGDQARAKLFKHGRSQAVRLPKEFRFEGNEVEVYRDGDAVVLKPIRRTRPDVRKILADLDALGPLDDFLVDRDAGLTPPKDVNFDT